MPRAKPVKTPKSTEQAFLALEAKRLRYAFEYDPVLGMSVSKIDPLPHQIEAVYKHVLKKSTIRFMLAHDPGAGKTVMAGLIIKEIELREGEKRVLIVVPGQLKEQWRWEMQDKFDYKFDIIDRPYFEANGKKAAWGKRGHIITSIDFAKRDDIIQSLYESAHFDIVIIDEAHKMSAYSSGRSTTKTRRYRLGETLAAITEHMLFLTATPHKGDTKNFQLLLDLLEPGYLAGDGMIEESIKKGDNPLFLRRAKEDMYDFEGNPLFMPRSVETPDVQMSAKERDLYNALSKYVKQQYNLASKSSRGHNVTFALIILQRRFASSTFALLESLRRRKDKLENLKKSPDMLQSLASDAASSPIDVMEKADEMSEGERWSEESKWELFSMAKTKEDLQTEIDVIDALISKAQHILKSGSQTKLIQLKSTIDALDRSSPGEKILVFTESKDTLDYLVSNIRSWGYAANTIHGAMQPKERRDAEAIFRDEVQIMVATEAAGEGINLQFCHLMVNYDLPWNPNRLEQRMGRIHRYGQKHHVFVFNMVAADTREGEIMRLLFEKLEIIKSAMGSDKIFDVISEIVPGKSLSQMLLDATVRARNQKDITHELAESLSLQNRAVMRYMKDGLASKFIDYTSLTEVRTSREKQLMPEYTRNIFEKAVTAGGGKIRYGRNNCDIASVIMPPDIINHAQGGIEKRYANVTFDKKIRMANQGIELMTFGHPAFDAVLRWAEQQYTDAATSGAVFTDVTGRLDGYLIFVEGAVNDGLSREAGKHLLAYYVDDTAGSAVQVSPSIVTDLTIQHTDTSHITKLARAKKTAASESAIHMKEFARTLASARDKEADLDKKYGLESMDALVKKTGAEIAALLDKKRRGKKMNLPIYNKRQERQRYRQGRRNLRDKIKTKTSLVTGSTRIVGAARVIPESDEASAASKAALYAAARFENMAGRTCSIKAGYGYGYDIRTTESADGQDAKYTYIQAKSAPPDTTTVTFTPNEWFRAAVLGQDCLLYYMDINSGTIYRVRDPAGVLDAEQVRGCYTVEIRKITGAALP